jgi:hypothetical protein
MSGFRETSAVCLSCWRSAITPALSLLLIESLRNCTRSSQSQLYAAYPDACLEPIPAPSRETLPDASTLELDARLIAIGLSAAIARCN